MWYSIEFTAMSEEGRLRGIEDSMGPWSSVEYTTDRDVIHMNSIVTGETSRLGQSLYSNLFIAVLIQTSRNFKSLVTVPTSSTFM